MSEALPITTPIRLAQADGNGQNHAMTDYRRNRVPGGTYFFTVNLADRRGDLLVRHIDALRDAVRQPRASAPFHIAASVVLPEPMHCLWTLPASDTDFSRRWQAIKTAFSKGRTAVERWVSVTSERFKREAEAPPRWVTLRSPILRLLCQIAELLQTARLPQA